MELIVGNKRITPMAIEHRDEGIEAILQGEALTSLLDATFGGQVSIEVLGGDWDRCSLEVSSIEMQGASTLIRLIRARGPAQLH